MTTELQTQTAALVRPNTSLLGTLTTVWRACSKPALAVPVVVWLGMVTLEMSDAVPNHRQYREDLETAAVAVLWPAVLLALVRLVQRRSGPQWWILTLAAVLLSREIHFTGAGSGVFVGLAVLLLVLVRQSAAWSAVISSPRFATPLAVAFACYVMSQSMDQRWWQHVPFESRWEVPAEETIEVAGHLCILLLAWFAPRLPDDAA